MKKINFIISLFLFSFFCQAALEQKEEDKSYELVLKEEFLKTSSLDPLISFKSASFVTLITEGDGDAGLLEKKRNAICCLGACYLHSIVSPREKSLYLLDSDKKIICGLIDYVLSEGHCHITNFAVHPAYQNKGVGKLFHRLFLKKLESKNICELLLTPVSTRQALNFYKKLGYSQSTLNWDDYLSSKPLDWDYKDYVKSDLFSDSYCENLTNYDFYCHPSLRLKIKPSKKRKRD